MQLTTFSPTHIAVLLCFSMYIEFCTKDITVVSFTKKSLIFVCSSETPGLCRPASVTRRSDTGALPPLPGADPWYISTHRNNAPGATPGMHRRKP